MHPGRRSRPSCRPRVTQRVWVPGRRVAHAEAFCNVASHVRRGRVHSRVANSTLSHSPNRLHDMTAQEAEALGQPCPPVGAQICHNCRRELQREAARRAKLQTETCGGCGVPGEKSIGDVCAAGWLGQGARRCRTCRRHYEELKRTVHPVDSPGRSKSKRHHPDTRGSVPRPPSGPKPKPPTPRKRGERDRPAPAPRAAKRRLLCAPDCTDALCKGEHFRDRFHVLRGESLHALLACHHRPCSVESCPGTGRPDQVLDGMLGNVAVRLLCDSCGNDRDCCGNDRDCFLGQPALQRHADHDCADGLCTPSMAAVMIQRAHRRHRASAEQPPPKPAVVITNFMQIPVPPKQPALTRLSDEQINDACHRGEFGTLLHIGCCACGVE